VRASVNRAEAGEAPRAVSGRARQSAVLALQRTAGNAAVTRLLQRRIFVGAHELTAAEGRAFVAGRSFGGRGPGLAERVIEDMAASGDDLRFEGRDELEQELIQRVSASALMTESQHEHRRAFGYPYRGQAALYGPRVNYAAREFWDAHTDLLAGSGTVAVDYADRSHDDAARRTVRTAQNDTARAAALHDLPPSYSFVLNARGRLNPAAALRALFVPQPPHLRTLIHCDYLVSIVQMLSLAQALGPTEFNARVARGEIGRTLPSGQRALVLWPFGFDDINVGPYVAPGQGHPASFTAGWHFPAAGGQALQAVEVRRPEDLVIGDHVRFYNHPAYRPLTLGAGEWQLENAILVDRRHGQDIFLGHGSGEATERQMRERLVARYNRHVREALRRARSAEHGDAAARAWLRAHFVVPGPAGGWVIDSRRIRDWGVVQELRELRADEVPGLYEPFSFRPGSPGALSPVRRPVASRDYPAESTR
jgi:hypothetical protein